MSRANSKRAYRPVGPVHRNDRPRWCEQDPRLPSNNTRSRQGFWSLGLQVPSKKVFGVGLRVQIPSEEVLGALGSVKTKMDMACPNPDETVSPPYPSWFRCGKGGVLSQACKRDHGLVVDLD